MKKFFPFASLSLLLLISNAVSAQLKVGDNPATINANSALEIESTNKGVLIPRIALTATNSASPLSGFTAGMLVYNTATAGTSPNQVAPGFYYCDGTQWKVAGSALTNINLSSPISPAGHTIGEMVYNTNPSAGLPVGPVYWDGTKWVTVGGSSNTAEVLTNGTPPVAPYLTGTAGTIYTDTASASPTLGKQFIWNGSSFVSYTAPNSTAFYNQNTTNDAGSAKATPIYRNGSIGIGNNTMPSASAQLDVNSTSKGLLTPRMTQAQRTAISAPATGLLVYQTDGGQPGFWYYNGSAWANIQTAQIGDIKSGFQTADHAGWVKLNGRLKSTLTATQQAQATALGIGANLPDATDKVLKQKSAGINTTGGNLQDSVAIVQANLPNITLSTNIAGAHTHNATIYPVGYSNGGGSIQVWNNADGGGSVTNTTGIVSAGSHQHTVSLNTTGTLKQLYVENAYLSVNMFIYLGN